MLCSCMGLLVLYCVLWYDRQICHVLQRLDAERSVSRFKEGGKPWTWYLPCLSCKFQSANEFGCQTCVLIFKYLRYPSRSDHTLLLSLASVWYLGVSILTDEAISYMIGWYEILRQNTCQNKYEKDKIAWYQQLFDHESKPKMLCISFLPNNQYTLWNM